MITGGQHDSIKVDFYSKKCLIKYFKSLILLKKVWDIDNGIMEASLSEQINIVLSFAISSNGLLVSGLSDGSNNVFLNKGGI